MSKCKAIVCAIICFISSIVLADNNVAVQDNVKNEFGACYKSFQMQLSSCNPSTCSYPDLSDAKTWRAHVIRGFVNSKCYVIYYSYLGGDVVGNPEHCFYAKEDLEKLNALYSKLFASDSAMEILDLKNQIRNLNVGVCQASLNK